MQSEEGTAWLAGDAPSEADSDWDDDDEYVPDVLEVLLAQEDDDDDDEEDEENNGSENDTGNTDSRIDDGSEPHLAQTSSEYNSADEQEGETDPEFLLYAEGILVDSPVDDSENAGEDHGSEGERGSGVHGIGPPLDSNNDDEELEEYDEDYVEGQDDDNDDEDDEDDDDDDDDDDDEIDEDEDEDEDGDGIGDSDHDDDGVYDNNVGGILRMVFGEIQAAGGGFMFRGSRGRMARPERQSANELAAGLRRVDEESKARGMGLKNSGEFGLVEDDRMKGRVRDRDSLPLSIHSRETARKRRPHEYYVKDLVPNTRAHVQEMLENRAYSGQFSLDGDFFYACTQDFMIRFYDTTNPWHWKPIKQISAYSGRWTITDATLSPGRGMLAYSSISPVVWIAPTGFGDDYYVDEDRSDEHIYANLNAGGCQAGVWSVRFSRDSRELIAGAGDRCIYAYDLEAGKVVLRLSGHRYDVNAVCYADDSSNIIYSGSDDSYVKVWDRRSMYNRKQAGVLVGHMEGITYIDSKGDGRYAVTNGKDQTCKLWDIRKMHSAADIDESSRLLYSVNFDYRWEKYPLPMVAQRPDDCSVCTYRGHEVLKTLIRCHFSPADSTGQRYIYSGSASGHVFVWTIEGELVRRMPISKGLEDEGLVRRRRRSSRLRDGSSNARLRTGACTRDVSWHPQVPVIASSSWVGESREQGVVATHSFQNRGFVDEGDVMDTSDYEDDSI